MTTLLVHAFTIYFYHYFTVYSCSLKEKSLLSTVCMLCWQQPHTSYVYRVSGLQRFLLCLIYSPHCQGAHDCVPEMMAKVSIIACNWDERFYLTIFFTQRKKQILS